MHPGSPPVVFFPVVFFPVIEPVEIRSSPPRPHRSEAFSPSSCDIEVEWMPDHEFHLELARQALVSRPKHTVLGELHCVS